MDTISNFINTLKIASRGGKTSFEFPATRLINAIADALQVNGYLAGVTKKGKRKEILLLSLVPPSAGAPKVRAANRISRLGKRVYRSARELHPIRNGFGMALLSTPKGILSDRDARKENAGGEVLFEIW